MTKNFNFRLKLKNLTKNSSNSNYLNDTKTLMIKMINIYHKIGS